MGKFIVFDGIECAGKSTQIKMAKQYLESKGFEVMLTREPGGTPLAESMREILIAPSREQFHPNAEMLLAYAAREQHLKNCIMPALEDNKVVLCDRFSSSTYIIQVLAHGGDISLFHDLERHIVKKHREPDAYLIFDLDPEVSAQRLGIRNEAPDRIEQGGLEFLKKAADGYQEFVEIKNNERPGMAKVIDASPGIEAVFENVCKALNSVFAPAPRRRPGSYSIPAEEMKL